MRCSGWSSRAIWASSAVAALLFATPAWAHLSVSPAKVKTGALVDLTFAAPNADDAAGIGRVTITPPAGFVLDDGEAKPGWTQSRAGGSITWSGGNIPPRQYATFGVRGTVPRSAGTIVFAVLVADRTGKSTPYRVGLEVAGASTDFGKPALAVAGAAALLALAAFFVGLYVWLRPPR
jgi:uncharacterized protein YcnI